MKVQGGFVLVATLWLVAALALLAAYINDVATANVESAIAEKTALESELALRSTEASVTYLLATSRLNHRGFILEAQQRFASRFPEELPASGDGELRVTDVPYLGLGRGAFSIQDENGLVSVNAARAPHFLALLEHVGISRSVGARLIGRVEDYVDTDTRLSLNGAEGFDYERAGLAPPADWIMQTPLELKRVAGFENFVSPTQWRRLRPLLTIRPQTGYNFNTMAPEVAAAMLRVDEQRLAPLLEARRTGQINSLREINRLTGILPQLSEEELVSLPGRFFRIRLWDQDKRSRRVIGLRLSAFGEASPWRKEYEYREELPELPARSPQRVETTLL